jgi:hypothetical protein
MIEPILLHRATNKKLSGGEAAYWTARVIIPTLGALIVLLVIPGIYSMNVSVQATLLILSVIGLGLLGLMSAQRGQFARHLEYHCYPCGWHEVISQEDHDVSEIEICN